jgi:hypothetical protein
VTGDAGPWRERARLPSMTTVRVECYAGYRADERPLRFQLGETVLEVSELQDRWYSPGAVYFRVLASDSNVYILRHDQSQDEWSLEAFRAPGRGSPR